MSWTPAITLRPREPPLPAVAVVATGAALTGLIAATRRALAAGADLHAATGAGWLVVLGAFEQLPWADGCRYLGRDGPLLVPTTRAIDPAPDLVAAALRADRADAALLVVLEDTVLRGPLPVRTADPSLL
jgi:hypothetical protein